MDISERLLTEAVLCSLRSCIKISELILKNWHNDSRVILVALIFPSAEYPAMCGVPINTLFNKSIFIFGSFSHTSITASDIVLLFNASSIALVSITSPREVL